MNFLYETKKHQQGYKHVIGVDEVGRGSLAGPVVAAAIVLPQVASENFKIIKSAGIKDSKLLSPKQRVELSEIIRQNCLAWAVGEISSRIIDKINIHNAVLRAMGIAARKILKAVPLETNLSIAVIDGKFLIPRLNIAQQAVIGGDNKILSVAAASIIAKVYRDGLMAKLHKRFPVYQFAQHKGYGTLHHREMILRHGLSPIHRASFCINLI